MWAGWFVCRVSYFSYYFSSPINITTNVILGKMMRLPPTKIELTARDLEWHGQRLQHRMDTDQPVPQQFRSQTQFEFHFPDDQIVAAPPFELSSLYTRSESTVNESTSRKKGKARERANRVSDDRRKVVVGSDGSSTDQLPSSSSPSKPTSRTGNHRQDELEVSGSSNPERVPVSEPVVKGFSHQLRHKSRRQNALLEGMESLHLDSEEAAGDNANTTASRSPNSPFQPTIPASDEHVTPPNEPQLPNPFSATPRNVSWNYSLPSSPILPRYSTSSGRSAPRARNYVFGSSPAASHEDNSQSNPSPSAFTQFNSTPPSMEAPRTPPPPRSAIRVYNDALPPHSQPQTPLGLPRHGVPPTIFSSLYTTPRPSTFAGFGREESIYGTPSRATRARLHGTSPREAPPGDGTIDQENASHYAEWDRRRREIREQRLGYGTGNTGELDRTLERTPPRETRPRPWE